MQVVAATQGFKLAALHIVMEVAAILTCRQAFTSA